MLMLQSNCQLTEPPLLGNIDLMNIMITTNTTDDEKLKIKKIILVTGTIYLF